MLMPRPSRVAAGLALVAAALLPACVHRTYSTVTTSAPSGIAPQLVVERFLRAANCVASANCATKAQDIDTMGKLFGTRDGSVLQRDGRTEVEQRMYALASLLQSEDYRVLGQNIVPGRVGEAVQLNVQLTKGAQAVTVPFILVHSRNGDWLVEQIDMAPLSARP